MSATKGAYETFPKISLAQAAYAYETQLVITPIPSTKSALVHNVGGLPSTLNEIRACAASMFSDPAVESVNVGASFGEVTVKRDGSIWMKEVR